MSKSIFLKNIQTKHIFPLMFCSILSGLLAFWFMFYILGNCTGKEWYIFPFVVTVVAYLVVVALFNISCFIELEFERKNEL